MFKLKGFTLAEVLVTLTILGIITAIIIPSIHNKYKNIQTVIKLKQIYAKFQTITDTAIIETGLQPENWLPNENKKSGINDKREIIYNNFIKPYLKTNNFNKDTGTFYDNQGTKYTLSTAPHNPDGFFYIDENTPNNSGYKFLLANLIVDINGDKKPNKYGQDIFVFTYKVKNKGPHSHPTQASNFEPLGCGIILSTKTPYEIYRDYAFNRYGTYPACNPSAHNECCADIIMRDGWKIKSDYPFKY